MSETNWVKWGEDVKSAIQSSIDSKDFSNLNENVGRIVNSAIKNVNMSLREAGETVNVDLKSAGKTVNQSLKNAAQSRNAGVRSAGEAARARTADGTVSIKKQRPSIPKLYGATSSTTGIGVVLTVFGFMGTAVTGILFLCMILIAIFGRGMHMAGSISIAFLLISASVFGGSLFMAVQGVRMIGQVNRFRRYVKELGNKMYCSIQELAKRTGKSVSYVQKDVRRMIKKGFFRQGHLDEKETCLMISDEAYEQYLQAQQQYLLREKERQLKESARSALPEKVRQVIAEGEAFIQKIHASNDAIPGEEISAKIDRMEHIVRRIFERVQQKPELVGDMKKMMEYYLPTTIKLLDAYEELDAQPVQGTNIVQSKNEIEKTMDTLNYAFEKMLDDFYQDTAWDISSDISVLETMLAQEGLTKSDF